MKNTCEIVWTTRAKNDLDHIFDYIESMWSQKEVSDFARLLESNLELIAKRPTSFKSYDADRNIHKCVISTQTTIFYLADMNNKKIVILTLFDNRRNPKSLLL